MTACEKMAGTICGRREPLNSLNYEMLETDDDLEVGILCAVHRSDLEPVASSLERLQEGMEPLPQLVQLRPIHRPAL